MIEPALPGRRWAHCTSPELAALDPERTVAVLPVGAVEQHGPHLPLATDTIVVEALAEDLRARPRTTARVLVLPTLAIGHSPEHADFPGTLSHAAEALLAQWTDVARDVARCGVRKLMLLNGHGGQRALVDLAAVRWRADFGMLVLRANWFALGTPAGLFDADELEHGIHGGEVETSLLLHLRPELVRRAALADFRARLPDGPELPFGQGRPVGFGWLARDLHAEGVVGNAARADAARGQRLYAHLLAELDRVIEAAAATALADVLDVGAGRR